MGKSFKLIGICTLVLMLVVSAMGCMTYGQDEFPPAYDIHVLYDLIEEGMLDGARTIDYSVGEPRASVIEKLERDIPLLMQTGTLYSVVLTDIGIQVEQEAQSAVVSLTLEYKHGLDKPLVVSRSRKDVVEALIDSWEQDLGKATILLQGIRLSTPSLFRLLDIAEINSANLPCEASQVNFEVLASGEDWQLVQFWLDFRAGEEAIRAKQAELTEATAVQAKAVLSKGLDHAKSEYWRVFGQIIQLVQYDEELAARTGSQHAEETSFERTAYGALVTGRTICNGYARAFKAICDALDLPCFVVSGSLDGVRHSWNAVPFEGEFYYIDCTAADSGRSESSAFWVEEGRLESLGYTLYPEYLELLPKDDVYPKNSLHKRLADK